MWNTTLREAYTAGRAELRRQCAAAVAGEPRGTKLLSYLFWENACCRADGEIEYLFHDEGTPSRLNVIGFDPDGILPLVEKTGNYRRLCVTTNWALDLRKFGTFDSWFNALSDKNRKKLRWLRNAVPKQGVRIVPIDSEARFRQFEEIYKEQFPKHPEDNEGVWKLYRELEARGNNFSRLMLDSEGSAVAGSLGYRNAGSFNFTHLTRKKGALDKFSPGFYLTFHLIQELYSLPEIPHYFFMGPGKYDYKPAFLGEPFPIYRYEKNTFRNLPGLIRLYHRSFKERKKAEHAS